MWFKNLTVYRMTGHWVLSAVEVAEALATNLALPLSSQQAIGHGWEPIFDDALVHTVNGQMLLSLKTEKKVIPSSALKAALKEKIDQIKDQTGRKPGRKEIKNLKEDVLMELLPHALVTTIQTQVWIDPKNGWIVINTGSPARADVVINNLIRGLEKLSLETLYLARDPGSVMTEWLSSDDAPSNFSIDNACELKSADESKASVKYGNSNLDADDLREHIKHGKRCVKLALTWDSRISFVLTDKFRVKQVRPLEIITNDIDGKGDEREAFDCDFTLMAAEYNGMLSALIEALGGEKPRSDLF
jgi:recombination associated protein RdgC